MTGLNEQQPSALLLVEPARVPPNDSPACGLIPGAGPCHVPPSGADGRSAPDVADRFVLSPAPIQYDAPRRKSPKTSRGEGQKGA